MAISESTPLLVPLGGESSSSRHDAPSLKSSLCTSSTNGNVKGTDVVPVLMEVIGCRDLPIIHNADVIETYCVVQYGTQTIHRTMPFVPKLSGAERVSRAFQLFPDANSIPTPSTDGDGDRDGDGDEDGRRSRRKTRLERNTENPIWTAHHDSLFVCNIRTPRDVDNHKAVVISVWARPRPKSFQDRALRAVASPIVQGRRVAVAAKGGNRSDSPQQSPRNAQQQIRFVGKVRIPAPDILTQYCRSPGQPERVEMQLVDDMGTAITNDDNQPARLSFRCRMASSADVSFVRNAPLIRNGGDAGIWPNVGLDGSDDTTLSVLSEEADVVAEPNRPRATLITEVPEVEIRGASFSAALAGSVVPTLLEPGKVKVKPYPDPSRVSKNGNKVVTQYMTSKELQAQTILPSRSWVQAGTMSSSSFGRLYIEVLSAKNLPNVDVGGAVGNQTDAFFSIIYADAMVETDVIDDELSPHFPPWSQRAFCFPIQHPYQVVYLAVFGFKRSPMQHRAIGRVEINPIHFQHNTTYDLYYALAASSHTAARTSNGTVRVRLRMEVDDERGYLLATLKPPPPVYINVKRKKSLPVARFTARGEYDNDEKFHLPVLQGCIDEILQGYVPRLLYAIQDGLRSLLLWRNQVFLFDGRAGFPIYSLLIFVLSILAVLSPPLIPGILCLEFALLMIVLMQHRINDPSPLRRCFGFGYYMRILITGKTGPPAFDKLEENTGLNELQALEKALEARVERDRGFFDKKDEVEKLIEELERDYIETKSKMMIPLEIMVVLGKVQGIVGNICRACRFIDTILTWEESSLSFFLTLAFLVGGCLLLLIPWAFILKWTAFLLTVLFLGPQNKILDLLYFRHQPTDDQRLQRLFSQKILEARVYQEQNRKMKSFRHLLFGKYSTSVPSIMWTPRKDFPLPNSSAHYCESSDILPGMNDVGNLPLVPGQKLYGIMIPRPEDAWKRNMEASLLARATYERSLRKGHEEQKHSDSIEDSDAVVGSAEEGFEVVEIYDEELGFVKNSLQPRRQESINELGVEILGDDDEELRFESAFRSVHDFDDYDNNSKSSENDDALQDPLHGRLAEKLPSSAPNVTSESNADEKNGQPFDGRRSSSSNLRDRPISSYGIEIAESFVNEARFVQQSWRGLSTTGITEEANGSKNDAFRAQDDRNNLKPSRIEGWSHTDDDLTWRTESPLADVTEKWKVGNDKFDERQRLGSPMDGSGTHLRMESSIASHRPPDARQLSVTGIEITETFEEEQRFVQQSFGDLTCMAFVDGAASARATDDELNEAPLRKHTLEHSRNEEWGILKRGSESDESVSNIVDDARAAKKSSETLQGGSSSSGGKPESQLENVHYEATVRMASMGENGFEVIDT